MKFAKPLVLPGAGFRTWLVLVAGVSAFTGVIVSVNPFMIELVFFLFSALFALLSLWPMGAALWVSVRYARLGQRQTAAAYALVPVAAVAIASLCGWTGFRVTEWSTAQAQVRQFSIAIEAARRTGQIVKTADSWIDPGPPTRAKFSLPGMFFVGEYVIYAEKSDVAWLNDQAKKCQAESRIVTLGRNFYRIAGEC